MSNITIKDVAKEAGVSISTISRYLANPGSINQITAVAVSKAINKFNYIPNKYAQNLKRGNSNIIAVILPDISNEFFSTACKSMSLLFYRNNYLLMICNTDDDDQKERFYIEEMLKNRVSGMIIASSGKNTVYLENILSKNKNIMLFDRLEADLEVDVVCEDNIKSGYDLAMHMIESGYNQFSIIAGTDYSVNTQYRLSGIKKAFDEAHISMNEKYLYKNITTKESVMDSIHKIITDKAAPKCVIFCNPKLLQSAVFAINKFKLSVPDKIALCGFCIDDPRYLFSFPVPAIVQNPQLIGLKSAEQMLKIIKNKNRKLTPKQIFVPSALIY